MNLSLLSALTVLLTLAGHCRALETGTKVSIFALTAKDSAIVEGAFVDLEGVLFIICDGSLTDQQTVSTDASPSGSYFLPMGTAVQTEQLNTVVQHELCYTLKLDWSGSANNYGCGVNKTVLVDQRCVETWCVARDNDIACDSDPTPSCAQEGAR